MVRKIVLKKARIPRIDRPSASRDLNFTKTVDPGLSRMLEPDYLLSEKQRKMVVLFIWARYKKKNCCRFFKELVRNILAKTFRFHEDVEGIFLA